MARRNPRREQLLEQVAARQRAVGQKVSRIERQGIRIRKEGLDPRQDMGAVRGMSTPQLHRYLARLDRFQDRSTNFVAGRRGVPIPKADWLEHERLKRAVNRQADAYEVKVGGIRIGPLGRTIGGRLDDRKPPDNARMGGKRRTFERIEREAGNQESAGAVREHIASMRKQLDPNYMKRRMRSQRRALKKMLTTAGEHALLHEMSELSDEQLNIAVDYTDLLEKTEHKYKFATSKNAGEKQQRFVSEAEEAYTESIRDLLTWAGTLPKAIDGETFRSGGAGEYTDTSARPLPIQFNPNDTRNNPDGIRLYTDTSARPVPVQKPRRDRKRKSD